MNNYGLNCSFKILKYDLLFVLLISVSVCVCVCVCHMTSSYPLQVNYGVNRPIHQTFPSRAPSPAQDC